MVISYKTIEVEVIVNEAPIINAQNLTIKINDSFNPYNGVTLLIKKMRFNFINRCY